MGIRSPSGPSPPHGTGCRGGTGAIEQLRLEGTFKDHPVPMPAVGRVSPIRSGCPGPHSSLAWLGMGCPQLLLAALSGHPAPTRNGLLALRAAQQHLLQQVGSLSPQGPTQAGRTSPTLAAPSPLIPSSCWTCSMPRAPQSQGGRRSSPRSHRCPHTKESWIRTRGPAVPRDLVVRNKRMAGPTVGWWLVPTPSWHVLHPALMPRATRRSWRAPS